MLRACVWAEPIAGSPMLAAFTTGSSHRRTFEHPLHSSYTYSSACSVCRALLRACLAEPGAAPSAPAGRGANAGVGFAIPIDSARGLVEQILKYGRVVRPVIGACLPACLAACLPACLPAWLPGCLPGCLPACLQFGLQPRRRQSPEPAAPTAGAAPAPCRHHHRAAAGPAEYGHRGCAGARRPAGRPRQQGRHAGARGAAPVCGSCAAWLLLLLLRGTV